MQIPAFAPDVAIPITAVETRACVHVTEELSQLILRFGFADHSDLENGEHPLHLREQTSPTPNYGNGGIACLDPGPRNF